MELSAVHRQILLVLVDPNGSESDRRRASRYGREFDDLRHARLIAYWPEGQPRPAAISAGQTPGRWYVSFEGEALLGRQTTTLRLAGAAG